MGGSAYLIPAPYTGMSSRDAHLRRNPPSGEPGTDYYMPTGTPLLAPARCRVVHIGGSVVPATGRYVTVDDGTRWLRFLHLKDWVARPGDELEPGELMAISGASGYGSEYFGEPYRNDAFWRNTGGDHVHVTAFRGRDYTFGSTGTVDFHAMTGGMVASNNAIPWEDDMNGPELQNDLVFNIRPGGYGVSANLGPTIWERLNDAVTIGEQAREAAKAAGATLFNVRVQDRNVFDWFIQAAADRATFDAKDAARDAAMIEAIKAFAAGQGADPDALSELVIEAARVGAEQSLAGADFPTEESIAAAVLSAQERARLQSLEAEVERLTALLEAAGTARSATQGAVSTNADATE